jgi:dUTP pyrophosphatase
MSDRVVVQVQLLRPDRSQLPSYATADSAGLDLVAAIDAPLTLASLERAAIETGIAIALPRGFEGQVRPRSGLAAKHGVTVVNAPGTIDADYRGEIKVIVMNAGDAAFTVRRGDRIAQLVIAPVARAEWDEVAQLETTRRGSGGFGHTGRRDRDAGATEDES